MNPEPAGLESPGWGSGIYVFPKISWVILMHGQDQKPLEWLSKQKCKEMGRKSQKALGEVLSSEEREEKGS